MDFNKSIDSIYSHDIFSSLIKNEVTVYGKFLRKVVFENISIEHYLTNDSQINAYTRNIFRDIIERDLDKYITQIYVHQNINSSSRCEFVTYKINYENYIFNLDISYIKSNISYYLSYYRSELDLALDIDCLYIDRVGLGALSINNLYTTAPSPFFKIINNIKTKKFKILNKNSILINKDCYENIKKLKELGWKNIENNIESIDVLKDNDKFNDDCAICGEKHNTLSIKLPCNHFFHEKCIAGYLDIYIQQKEYLDKELQCPYCTNQLNILHTI